MKIPSTGSILPAAVSDNASETHDPLRILIFSADVGEGHVAAARALEEGLLERGGASVVNEDGLRYLGWCARRLIRDGYRGEAPRFAYNQDTRTMSNRGGFARGRDGSLRMTDGYRVLIDIEDYAGKEVVASLD